MVDDGGDLAIGVELEIPWLLLNGLWEGDCLHGVVCAVGDFELFECNGCFEALFLLLVDYCFTIVAI